MRKTILIVSGVAVFSALFAAFLHDPASEARASIDVVYPIKGSIFPPDFVVPTFLWHDNDSDANYWSIEIANAQGDTALLFDSAGDPPPAGEIDETCISSVNEIYVPPAEDGPVHAWTPNAETWQRIQQHCGQSEATVSIMGLRKDRPQKILSTGGTAFSVSKDPVGSPIFYRDMPLMPSEVKRGVIKPLAKEALPLVVWRLRDVSKPHSRIVMKDMPSCANCHTFSGDGKTLGMDIDGPLGDKGAYAVAPISKNMVIEKKDLITWNSFTNKPDGHKTIGFMSQISPDGQYVVTTLNESVHVVNFPNYKFVQVFYPTHGILAYYSRQTDQIEALSGADDPAYVHCDPAWSPDGKVLVFARAQARDPYPEDRPLAKYPNDPNELQIQYDLYRMPFNDGRGGVPEPISGASRNGMSNTFPKLSPDGRWIVFVKCRNGQLLRPDSRLWIVPTNGGEAREMRCNTALMNSWHSFAPNGRWMVFSSKSNTPYTQLFLTHIDENGLDSPAILIPNSTAANRAANLPEFGNFAYGDLINIDVPAVDWRRPLDRGENLLNEGKFTEAVAQFRESLAIEPNEAQSHFLLGISLDSMQQHDEAIEHYTNTLKINDYHPGANNNLGILLARQEKFEQAIAYFQKTAETDPSNASAQANWGKALMGLGEVEQAIDHYRKSLAIDPAFESARVNLERALTMRDERTRPKNCGCVYNA